MGDALEALRIIAVLTHPAVPGTAAQIWERLGMTGALDDQRIPDAVSWGGYPGGTDIVKGDPLFPRIAS